MFNGIFINADKNKPVCSIYYRGLSAYDSIKLSKVADIEYCDVSSDIEIPYYINNYDFVIFNYHSTTMANISPKLQSEITIPTIGLIWDMPKMANKVSHWHNSFTYAIYPDPLLKTDDDSIWQFDRIVPRTDFSFRDVNIDNPIISTFGIPDDRKSIDGIMDAINQEFDQATFRINFSPGSHIPGAGLSEIRRRSEIAAQKAKPGIEVVYSESFMEFDQLMKWLNDSDLNIFFYDKSRDQTHLRNLPSTLDDAIAAKRPIAVSDNECTMHFTQYQNPYPLSSLKEIMKSGDTIQKLYDLWSPQNFASRLDGHLERMLNS